MTRGAPSEERARLEEHIRQLRLEIAALDHEGRRHRDASERSGGRAAETESAMMRVKEGHALCMKDLKRAEKQLRALLTLSEG